LLTGHLAEPMMRVMKRCGQAHRVVVICAAFLLASCVPAPGSLPGGYDVSRLGAMSDAGLLIGEGHLKGIDRWGVAVDMDWQILAYAKEREAVGHLPQACTASVFQGVIEVDSSCSSISADDGLPGVGLSLGSPTVISGLLNPWVSEVRIELADGEFIPELVPLGPVGLEGSGFALVLIGPDAFVAVREYNARGSLLRDHRHPIRD
jgi:hypothetical protein